jgi:hypothetical protein
MRKLAIAAGVATLIMVAAGTVLADQSGWFGGDNPWPYQSPTASPVLATVGDISCQPGAKVESEKKTDTCDQGSGSTLRNAAQNATAMEVEQMKPDLVAVLGDEQYQNGYYSDFEGSYDKYWGAFKFLQRPAPGNHEFYDNHGQAGVRGIGYFDYFNGIQHNADGSEIDQTVTNADGSTVTQPVSGTPVVQPTPQPDGQAGEYGKMGDGWYSYNLGDWHLISLNIECADEPGGCDPNGQFLSAETAWLTKDLALDHNQCTLAYWHQPTFTVTDSGSTEGTAAKAWWKLLYAHGADVILNGHEHVYARLAPLNPDGQPDPAYGIRQFTVGTGGESLDTLDPNTPNLQAGTDEYYGVMKMTLNHNSYSWDFESAMRSPAFPDAPPTYSDSGSARCHGAPQGS